MAGFMRALAIIFSAVGFFLFAVLFEFMFQFIPFHPSGPEGVAVVAMFAPVLGIVASFLGLIFGFGVIVCGRREKIWWILLTCCCVQILGLIALALYAG